MKIICIGRNYIDHAKELNNPVPKKPLIFMKPASALLIKNKPFYYPEFSEDVHYEAEIVLKISKNGRHVQPEFARDYFNEVSIGIDFTARDVQAELKKKGHPWEIAKGFDHSAVLNKFISIEKLPSVSNIEFCLHKNGEKVQHGFSKDQIFSFQDIICYVSKFFKLQMGDYIFTGTPAGVGPVKIGDELSASIKTNDGFEELMRCEVK